MEAVPTCLQSPESTALRGTRTLACRRVLPIYSVLYRGVYPMLQTVYVCACVLRRLIGCVSVVFTCNVAKIFNRWSASYLMAYKLNMCICDTVDKCDSLAYAPYDLTELFLLTLPPSPSLLAFPTRSINCNNSTDNSKVVAQVQSAVPCCHGN